MQVVEFGSNGTAATAEPEPEGAETRSQLQLVRALVVSFPWVVALILLGAVVGVVVGLLQPNRYESNAKLVLRVGAREQISSEALLDFEQRQRSPGPTLPDELHMLSDMAIFEDVARELGPSSLLSPSDPALADGPETPALVRLVHSLQGLLLRSAAGSHSVASEKELLLATRLLQEDTRVSSEPGSSVILVSHTSGSPERARTVVRALVAAFIERHRVQYSIGSLLERSRSQVAEVKRARDAAAEAYIEQMSRSGISEFESRVPGLELELRKLEEDLFAARVRDDELGKLREALGKRLQGIPAEIELRRPTVMVPNEDYETQLVLKRTLLASRQEMLVKERPSEETRRREQAFDRQIAALDQKLAGMPKTIPQGLELQENLGHSAMEARIVELELEHEALPAKIELLESRRNVTQANLSEIQKQLLTATMLRNDLASARDAEEARYVRQVDHLAFLEALESVDADGQGNLRVLQAATLEQKKIGPERMSLLLKGLFVGLCAAVALALLRQRFERRLRHPDTFELARGVPVLGVVPHLGSLRRRTRHAASGVS